MAHKQKKKRTKRYTGSDASSTRPIVTRIVAVKRNPIQQWWLENKRVARPIGITTAIVIAAVWLIYELIRVINGF